MLLLYTRVRHCVRLFSRFRLELTTTVAGMAGRATSFQVRIYRG